MFKHSHRLETYKVNGQQPHQFIQGTDIMNYMKTTALIDK